MLPARLLAECIVFFKRFIKSLIHFLILIDNAFKKVILLETSDFSMLKILISKNETSRSLMIESIKDSPLYPIANPKSIAVFGASNRITSMGTSLLDSILNLGFEGDLYPIHPKENRVQNLKAYRSVLDLPNVPDLAMIGLPTHIVSQALDACGRKGIEHAMITQI